MIDKACEWLRNYKNYSVTVNGDIAIIGPNFIEDFRKAMEE